MVLTSIHIHITQNPKDIRNEGIGDWWEPNNGAYQIMALDLGDDDSTAAVGIHEFIEQRLCEKHGIPEAVVNAWDAAHEGDEPGDDPEAPYHKEHMLATMVEDVVRKALGVDSVTDEREVN